MTNGLITQYSIRFSPSVIGNNTFNEQMGTVEGLLRETEYTLQLTAFTRAGEGPPINNAFITRESIYTVFCMCFMHTLYT